MHVHFEFYQHNGTCRIRQLGRMCEPRLREARPQRSHSVGAGHCILIDKGVPLAFQEGDTQPWPLRAHQVGILGHDPNARRLVQYDLGRRVIDAENIGFSYGKEVLNTIGYSFIGVRKAVEYFRKNKIWVVVVCKRDLEQLRAWGEDVESLWALGGHL